MMIPGRLLGTGATAEVFEYGGDALKLYSAGIPRHAADREAAILDLLGKAGIAAPRGRGVIEHQGRWGLAMTRAPGRPFAEAMLSEPASVASHLEALVEMHIAVHSCPAPGLRSYEDRLADHIGWAERLTYGHRERLLAHLAAMPKGDRLCHGDFHPFNVLGTPGDAVIIDWVDATAGLPMADLARTYVLLRAVAPELAEAYVERYLAVAGDGRQAIDEWLPLVAAGRLGEKIDQSEVEPLLLLVRRDNQH